MAPTLELGLREQGLPMRLGIQGLLIRIRFKCVDRAVLGIISGEKGSINIHAHDSARGAKLNDAVVTIISGSEIALTSALPAIHPLAVFGVFVGNEDRSLAFEEVLLASKKIIVGVKRLSSDLFARKIKKLSERDKKVAWGLSDIH